MVLEYYMAWEIDAIFLKNKKDCEYRCATSRIVLKTSNLTNILSYGLPPKS